MKPIRILVLMLCAGFAWAAWGQQATCKAHTGWAEFHRNNMRRSNPCEKVLNVRHFILCPAGNCRHIHQQKRQDPQSVDSQ